MNRRQIAFGAASACLLAGGVGVFASSGEPTACPALKVSYFGLEPHEKDVRWIVAQGVPCRLLFAYDPTLVPPSDIRYEIYQQPKAGHVSVDTSGVIYDAPAEIRSETFGLVANIPGRNPVRSVMVVGRRT
jgi:hypothetical protein